MRVPLGGPPWEPPEAPSSSTLQLTMAGAGLAYHAASSHLVTLTGEVTDHFQKGFFHEFLDLSLVTSWNQVWKGIQGLTCSVRLPKGGGHPRSRRF